MKSNVQIIRSLYATFARGDLEAVRAAFNPEIVWLEAEGFPYADHNPYPGPDAVLEGAYARLVQEWDRFSEELTGTYRSTGESVRAEFAHVWTLSEGRVARFRQYTDTLAFERAIHPPSRA